MLQTWHKMFSNAAPDVIEWAGEKYSIQMAPGSQFVIKSDHDSPGIQMADVALWLYRQMLKGKDLPPKCASVLNLMLERGWHNDFSFDGVQEQMIEKWGEVMFGPIEQDKLDEAQKMLEFAEERRRKSMAQFEADGQLPFMRGRD